MPNATPFCRRKSPVPVPTPVHPGTACQPSRWADEAICCDAALWNPCNLRNLRSDLPAAQGGRPNTLEHHDIGKNQTNFAPRSLGKGDEML